VALPILPLQPLKLCLQQQHKGGYGPRNRRSIYVQLYHLEVADADAVELSVRLMEALVGPGLQASLPQPLGQLKLLHFLHQDPSNIYKKNCCTLGVVLYVCTNIVKLISTYSFKYCIACTSTYFMIVNIL
jgi:hypothetical protein